MESRLTSIAACPIESAGLRPQFPWSARDPARWLRVTGGDYHALGPAVFVSGNRGAVMPQAIANPEELRAFALKLKQFNSMLSDQAGMLSTQLESLSATWRDQENAKFCEQFKEHLRLLAQFVDVNSRHIPYLLRKAERLDEYLNQR